MVKVIDRILYKLDDLVRPYVHKILVVIEPMLIDEDYYARVEGARGAPGAPTRATAWGPNYGARIPFFWGGGCRRSVGVWHGQGERSFPTWPRRPASRR